MYDIIIILQKGSDTIQNEIKVVDNLLNEKGNLKHKGYSKKMVLKYDRSHIKASGFKIKEWDYYLINNEHYAVALTIADNSYMSLLSISLIDFETKKEVTKSVMSFFTFGKLKLPSSSTTGDVEVNKKNIQIAFKQEDGKRILTAKMKNFEKNVDFSCYFELTEEPEESIVIATPFDKPKAFYYNQKIVGFNASGYVTLNDKKIEFSNPDTLGILDWGRGVWTYKNTWYWGALATKIDGQDFGFNIGYGFGNTFAASENAVFLNGKLHKLTDVTFNIPKNKKGKDNFLAPWSFTSSDKRFQMEFLPILDRAACTNFIVLCSDQHQVFGRFNGYVILDDGKKIIVKNKIGFAEKVYNKW